MSLDKPAIGQPNAILIAGPTASGKSEFALRMADTHKGVIINADSMQVYQALQIITARPTQAQMAPCDHHLYGHREAAVAYSVAQWLEEVSQVLNAVRAQGKTPIFVGGTGLYFRALLEGLSPVPELDERIRRYWRAYATAKGGNLHEQLLQRDPIAANFLRPSDHQRLIRALEVIDSTGKSLIEWQNNGAENALLRRDDCRKLVIMPPRALLHERINRRFDGMVEAGALAEVEKFLALDIVPTLPAMKAIGVPQFASYLAGKISQIEAIEKSKAASRQYAKRQCTWFNNQFGDDWEVIETFSGEDA